QERFNGFLALRSIRDAFQYCEMVEKIVGRHPRVDAEVLRQVAKHRTQSLWLCEHIDVAETNASLRRRLQCCDAPHERRFAGSIGPEQAEHPFWNLERHVIQRSCARGVDMSHARETEHRFSNPDCRQYTIGRW